MCKNIKLLKKVALFFSLILIFYLIFHLCFLSKKDFFKFNVEEYGIVANDINSAQENSKALNEIIKLTKKYKNSEINFPKNTYYFDTSDNAILCDAVKNVSFIGDDTFFINSSYENSDDNDYLSTCFISVNNSENIRIKNINFDYQDYTSINGVVVENKIGEITVKIDDAFLEEGYHRAITGDEIVYAVNEFTPEDKKCCGDYYLNMPTQISLDKEEKTVKLSNFATSISLGNEVVMRFDVGKKIPAFMVAETDGFYMENVNVYSSAGATVYSPYGCKNFEFKNFNIIPKEGSEMLYSSNVDGVHLKNFSGKAVLKDCSFEGMGDDSFNLNSRAVVIRGIDGKNISVNSGYNGEDMPKDWAKKGDVLNVYNSRWEQLGQITVKDYKDGKIKAMDLVEKGFSGCILENTRFLPEILIENTTVNLSRARGLMLRSKNVAVKGCTFKNTALPAIIISPDINNWYEMSPAENIEISNCVFDNCATSNKNNGGIVTIKYADDNLQEFSSKIHKNINISNNAFKNHGIYAIFAMGVDGLTIENNEFENDDFTVYTSNCSNVRK